MIELSHSELALEQHRFEVLAEHTDTYMSRHLKETVRPDDFRENPDRSRFTYRERQPIDWRATVEKQIGLPADTPAPELFGAIRRSHDLWLPYLQERFSLDDAMMKDIRRVRDASFIVGTLTEDNLPGYKEVMHLIFMRAPANVREIFLSGLGLWTGEEDGHGRALDAYGEWTDLLTGEKVLKGWRYAASRTRQLRRGSSEVPGQLIPLKAYTSEQEIMAEIAHNKSSHLHDPIGYTLLTDIGGDEARHGRWFGDEVGALVEEFPEDVMDALYDTIFNAEGEPTAFAMPGSEGIHQYTKLSVIISNANLLSRQDYFDTIVKLCKQWNIRGLTVAGGKSKAQQEAIVKLLDYIDTQKEAERPMRPGKFVLEQTLTTVQLREARKEYPAYLTAAA